jgi:hypothetical protein
MGNPAPLVNMVKDIYPKNNIIFDNGTAYYVAAQNGVAQGTRKPIPCTSFNHGMGFGLGFAVGTPSEHSAISVENIDRKLAYRQLYEGAVWGSGFFRGGGGGSHGGQRMISATIAGKTQDIAIDTGTDAILGAGSGSKSCVFPPNQSAISVPSTSHSQANYYYVPAYNISQRIRVCLTNQYTICQRDRKSVV